MSPLLIVEDDSDIREMLQGFLEEEGYRVWSAVNGEDALSLLNAQSEVPGLILLDLMMPVMDGETFLTRLSAEPCFRDVPVLLLTADPIQTSHVVAGYLKKPLDLDQLLESVDRLVKA